jgi:hypothetical protein
MSAPLRRRLVVSLALLSLACSQDPSGSAQPELTRPDSPSMSRLPFRRILVTPPGDSLAIGESVQLVATAVDEQLNPVPLSRPFRWSSDNPAIVSVSSSGLATAQDVGTATISATLEGKSGIAVIAVFQQSVASVTVTPGGDTLGVGANLQLTVLLQDAQGNPVSAPVSFSSSNPGAADVSPTGLVTTTGLGSTTIVATSQGVAGTASILVADCATTKLVTTTSWVMKVAPNGIQSFTGTLPGGTYKQTGVLFAGGPMFGTDVLHFVLGYNTSGQGADIAAGAVCILRTTPTQQTWSRLSLNPGVGAPPGLVTTQETYATSFGGLADVVLFRYVFTNTGANSITNFSAGFDSDWDITFDFNAGNDIVRYNATLGIGEVVEQDTVTHQQIMAIVPVAASGGTSFRGWLNGQDPTHDGFFGFLTGGVVPGFTGPSDVREMMGRGPVSIAAGGHVTVYFAIVGGDNRTAFNANVAAARAAAVVLGF